MKKERLDPIHPGEILQEEFMKPLNIGVNELAACLHVPANRISQIIHGKRSISADTAIRLGLYFGTSKEVWLGLQNDYDLEIAERKFSDHILKRAA